MIANPMLLHWQASRAIPFVLKSSVAPCAERTINYGSRFYRMPLTFCKSSIWFACQSPTAHSQLNLRPEFQGGFT